MIIKIVGYAEEAALYYNLAGFQGPHLDRPPALPYPGPGLAPGGAHPFAALNDAPGAQWRLRQLLFRQRIPEPAPLLSPVPHGHRGGGINLRPVAPLYGYPPGVRHRGHGPHHGAGLRPPPEAPADLPASSRPPTSTARRTAPGSSSSPETTPTGTASSSSASPTPPCSGPRSSPCRTGKCRSVWSAPKSRPSTRPCKAWPRRTPGSAPWPTSTGTPGAAAPPTAAPSPSPWKRATASRVLSCHDKFGKPKTVPWHQRPWDGTRLEITISEDAERNPAASRSQLEDGSGQKLSVGHRHAPTGRSRFPGSPGSGRGGQRDDERKPRPSTA